jgi:hypothetical protein
MLAVVFGWYFCVIRWDLYPPPGTYIGVFAFFGAVLTIFPPNNRWSKAFWIMVFAGLLILEINTLYVERSAYQRQQSNTAESFSKITKNLDNVANKFSEVARSLGMVLDESRIAWKEERKQFTSLLNRQETLFSRQERLAKETLAKVKEREGALIPANLPSPVVWCNVPPKTLAVYFAGGAAWGMQFPYAVIRSRHLGDIITLDKDQHGGFLVSVKVFDDRGDLVVNIEKNQFIATYAASHLYKTDNNLVIYDRKGTIVLSVHFMNQYAFKIAGKFYTSSGSYIDSDDKRMILMPSNNTFSGNCASGGKAFLLID